MSWKTRLSNFNFHRRNGLWHQTELSLRPLCGLLCILLFLSGSISRGAADVTPENNNERRNQLEELFIWKTSEELKLSQADDKAFTEIVKSLNKKKFELNEEMHEIVVKMAQEPTDKKKLALLNQYKKTLQTYNHLSEEEIDKMKSLLGIQKLSQYLKIKQDITRRVKSLLANPDSLKKSGSPLPSPKVIEEEGTKPPALLTPPPSVQ